MFKLKVRALPKDLPEQILVDVTALDAQVDAIDRDEALELLRQATRLENDFGWGIHAEAASIAT